jgi:hypothetical protein
MSYTYNSLHLEAQWVKMKLAQRFQEEQTPADQLRRGVVASVPVLQGSGTVLSAQAIQARLAKNGSWTRSSRETCSTKGELSDCRAVALSRGTLVEIVA